MPPRRRLPSEHEQTPRPPATSPEQRENQLINLAVDVAEKQMREGTASAQVISHFLKLGSSRERLEQERLAHENELLQVKAEAIASQKRSEELFDKALKAIRRYQGEEDEGADDIDGR